MRAIFRCAEAKHAMDSAAPMIQPRGTGGPYATIALRNEDTAFAKLDVKMELMY